jgi:hypothetical protein
MPTYIVYYSQGSSNGPFDIYLSGSSGLNLYASNIQKYQLVNGYLVTFPDGIPSSSVDVFDVSYGCFTDQNVPFPSVSPSITPSISITPTRTPSITVSPSITPSVTATPSATPSVTPPPSITPSLTPSVTPSLSPGASSSPTPSITPSRTITRTPSPSPPANYTAYQISTAYSSAYLACYNVNRYGYTGGFVYLTSPPAIGVRVYINISGYVPFNGGSQYYAISNWGPAGSAIVIDSSGYITSFLSNYCFGI